MTAVPGASVRGASASEPSDARTHWYRSGPLVGGSAIGASIIWLGIATRTSTSPLSPYPGREATAATAASAAPAAPASAPVRRTLAISASVATSGSLGR